jgi:hypothetical protein
VFQALRAAAGYVADESATRELMVHADCAPVPSRTTPRASAADSTLHRHESAPHRPPHREAHFPLSRGSSPTG